MEPPTNRVGGVWLLLSKNSAAGHVDETHWLMDGQAEGHSNKGTENGC